jgi:hypothetical protein
MFKADKILLIALILGFVFTIHGIHWGRVEPWNPDQRAFHNLNIRDYNKYELPLHPSSFGKPPFHTYFNLFLSSAPVWLIGGKILNYPIELLRPVRLIWSRILTIFLFLGSIGLVYFITRRFFDVFAARGIAIIYSTSAGFIYISHYLTADMPVMFWMLLAFYFAQNVLIEGKLRDYLLAGFFTGIATATKYNGIVVGIAIVTAHTLLHYHLSWRKLLLDRKLYLGLIMVVAGFIFANPYALIKFSTFFTSFMRMYNKTPVDGGIPGTHGYVKFFWSMIETVGLPSFLFLSLSFLFSLYFSLSVKGKNIEKQGVLLILPIFLLHYYKIGSFQNMQTRYVMPCVPFLLIMSGLLWNKIKNKRAILLIVLTSIVSYNIICSYYVGRRFTGDPRMKAQEWVKENIAEGSSIESTMHSPYWDKLPGVQLNDIRMPFVSGRGSILFPVLRDNRWAREQIIEWKNKEMVNKNWFSRKQLKMRNPDYIGINSLYYNRFVEGQAGDFYPSIKIFFEELLDEKYSYKRVFDQESRKYPSWIYPKKIEYTQNRMIIFKRMKTQISGK